MPAMLVTRPGNTRLWVLALVVAPAVVVLLLYLLNPTLHATANGIIGHALGKESNETPLYNPDQWFFQAEIEFALPKFDIHKLKALPPHNYKGRDHDTFATFFVTRGGTTKGPKQDPYFISALQIIYRLLWAPGRRSEKHPVVVFVTQYVPDEQRDYLAAAGAIVRELPIREFEPVDAGVPARLQDLFSKLEMWQQTDFHRIAYLDGDAFPMNNCDPLFDFAPDVQCKQDLLKAEESHLINVCDYALAAYHENGDELNAGVLVLKPDYGMYERLLREVKDKEGWNTGFMEQAFLSHVFAPGTAFPASPLPHEWNGGKDVKESGGELNILHHKAWAEYFTSGSWVEIDYNNTWAEMLALYESPEFLALRMEDLKHAQDRLQRFTT